MTARHEGWQWSSCRVLAGVAMGLALSAGSTAAQELTPRAYWPAPKGTAVAVLGYTYVSGDVFFDRSTPLYGVDSKFNVGLVAYLETFSLWNRTTNVLVELPYSWGVTKGTVVDTPARRDFSGIGDLGITMMVNLLGAPTMDVTGFQELRANPRPILGASLKILAPTGAYDSNRLINVGTNRWAARTQFGFILPLRPKWHLELVAGMWYFGDDPDFLVGRKEQEPIFQGLVHLVRRFRPGLWASLDFTYFAGGRQTIGGQQLNDVQKNSKVGFTVVLPFRGRNAIKLGYAIGAHTEYGADFDQYLVVYQRVLK